MATFHRLIYSLNNNETECTLITEKGKDLLKAYLARLKKNGSVFLGVFLSETQKLRLRRIVLNSHTFSENVLVRLLFSFNAKKIHTFVN